MNTVAWTITDAAREWGIDDETLKRRLTQAGVKLEKGATYTTRQISDAVVGSLQREKIRLTSADADLKERDRFERDGILIRVDDAKKLIADALGPIRSSLVSWPMALASRCNPGDPELARVVLAEAVKNLLTNQE